MARITFFSFHYQRDVHRAMVVRNSWVTKADREDSGFFDSSVFESKQRDSDDALKAFLTDGLKNTSVTCVLVGAETTLRRWVRFEIFRSFMRGNGLFAVHVNGIKNLQQQVSDVGSDPFAAVAFAVTGDRLHFKEYKTSGWKPASDVGSMPLSDVAYNLNGMANNTFGCLFPTYDWMSDDGYNNLGGWIEQAAAQAAK